MSAVRALPAARPRAAVGVGLDSSERRRRTPAGPTRLDTTAAGTTKPRERPVRGCRAPACPGWAHSASRALGMPTVNTVSADALRSSIGNVDDDEAADDDEADRRDPGQEQLQDVLHPVEDPLALLDRLRDRRERVLHQHEVGDAARRLAAAAHRDREVGLLERQHVVHAVADHRDVVAARPQRVDEALLLGRRDPAEHRVASATRAERRRRRGRRARCPAMEREVARGPPGGRAPRPCRGRRRR